MNCNNNKINVDHNGVGITRHQIPGWEENKRMSDLKDLLAGAMTEEKKKALDEMKKKVRASYGENKRISDGNYDKSLAVKCINGTFVGRKTGDVIAYKGIPFTGKPPVGELRWKAPVEYVPDDGIYEAYYNGKIPRRWRISVRPVPCILRARTACI